MKELVFEELTLEQKIGLVLIGGGSYNKTADQDNFENCLELIRKHALGAMWVCPVGVKYKEKIAAIREAADYPILIFSDAENGMNPYIVGRHGAIGYTDSEDLAYAFGRVTALRAREDGYNIICNPIVDMTDKNVPCGGTVRSLGSDKYKTSRLAAAIARGMHDAGILTVAKHYPGAQSEIDSHMAEIQSDLTEAELLDYNLYPYMELMKENLIDGIMTSHEKLPAIDDIYPVSLSKKATDILRRQGYEGLFLTDALSMMGVVAKFGKDGSRGLSIAGGNDLALVWDDVMPSYESIKKAYESGLITDECLDAAVKHVLAAQHKALVMSEKQPAPLCRDDEENIVAINRKCIAAVTDDGLLPSLDTAARHFFIILTEGDLNIDKPNEIDVDTFSNKWYRPLDIADRIRKHFPNSAVYSINQFPSSGNNYNSLERSILYDDVVFVTFCDSVAYAGREAFTSRFLSLVEALQITNRVSAVVHFGNPFLLEELPHIPRILNGCLSYDCTLNAIDILAGIYPAEGKIPYELKLK